MLVLGLMLLGSSSADVRAQDAKDPDPKGTANGVEEIKVAVNSIYRLQSPNKLKIKQIRTDREQIIRVTGVEEEPWIAQITGLQPGTAILTLTTFDDPKTKLPIERSYKVVVQLDVELLRTLLKEAVPTASVTPLPGAGNTIILTGTVAHSEDIGTIMGIANSISGGVGPAQIINAMRVGGVMQVQLDVVVALVAREEVRRMSVDIFDVGQNHIYSNVPGGGFNTPAPGTGITGNLPGGPFTIQNIVGSPNQVPFNTFLAIFNSRQAVFFFLQALRTNNLAKVLAEPHLVTMSGRPATFLSGGEQAVPEVGGFGGVAGTRFEPFGTRLQFLPIVLGNGKIYLEVEPEVSQLSAANGSIIGGALVAGRAIQRVRTSIMMEDGQTFAVGGLIQKEDTGTSVRVPVIGDLPFIGPLFGSKEYQERETELLILVTPHLVDAMDCAQVPRLLPGQETRRPDDFELFLENILEAPRGSRKVNEANNRYVPAWKRSPTATQYPCLSSSKQPIHGCPECGTASGVPLTENGSLLQPGPLPTIGGNVVVETPEPSGSVQPASGTMDNGGVLPLGGTSQEMVPTDGGAAGTMPGTPGGQN